MSKTPTKREIKGVILHLRGVADDAARRAKTLSDYADSWADVPETDFAQLAELHVVKRALEQLDSVAHVHSGGTDAMHIRQAQAALLDLLEADK